MAARSDFLPAPIMDYIVNHAPPDDPVLESVVTETRRLGGVASMQIGRDEGTFLGQLVRLSGARRAIELGTFTGYSSICIARALGPEGRLLCCDVNPEWTAVARRHWEKAGVAGRIELRLAPALETLRQLPREPYLDFAFIDAVKTEYVDYYEELVPRMRPGGVMVADNVLWSGLVADPGADDENTRAMRTFNHHVGSDPRTEAVILAVADGVSLITLAGSA